jgi:hypothetical protein
LRASLRRLTLRCIAAAITFSALAVVENAKTVSGVSIRYND